MGILKREEILNSDDLKTECVEVPEWGGSVYVRALTGEERDTYEASVVTQKGKDTQVNMKNARAKLVTLATVDESGAKIFTQADVAALGKKSAAALSRIFNTAMRLSGISESDLTEMTKEIQASPFGVLPTD